MDRFLVKPEARRPSRRAAEEQAPGRGAEQEEGEEGPKRPRREPGAEEGGSAWRKVRARDLDCDYTVLFGREEADGLLRALEQQPWIPVLEHIRDRVAGATGHTFNFVLVNRYKDGCDHIGEHRDDESELAPQSPIASVSFGACRDFFFRHRDSRGKESSWRAEVVKLQLAHGSLLMMNYPTNVHWYHSLPVRKRILAPRINLTFRNILSSKR